MIAEEVAESADEPTGEITVGRLERWGEQVRTIHPAAWLTAAGALLFALIFGKLGVQHQDNFGTWSYDMGIYDQGFWLVSRGGQSFMTVRGLEFWGQHVNLIVVAFVPFYWLGAGPSFLYVAQAVGLGAAALPIYLIARDRFAKPWMGLLFAVVYLMYAPIQWISWANFHPEALVIAPLLYAWWFATHKRWRGMFIALLIALSVREDAALVVIVMGLILLLMYRPGKGDHRDRVMALTTFGLGVVWYAIATRIVIPHFNQGRQPFYIEYFYSNYGKDMPQIISTILRHPNRVIGDATQPDRIRFYRDLALPLGGLPLVAPLTLLMAAPQMLASVIGLSPYAAHHPLPVHGHDDRAVDDLVDRGGASSVPLQGDARPPADLVGRLCLHDQRRLVPVADRRFLQRVGAAAAEACVDARSPEAGSRQRLRFGDVHAAATPLAPRPDLRLAQPVGALVLGK